MKIERQFLFWLAVFGVALVLLALLKDVLLPFVVGMILAYALNPVADRLERWGLSRLLASAIVLVLIISAIGLAAWFLVPALVTQLQGLIESLPDGVKRLVEILEQMARERLGDRFGDVQASVDKAIREAQVDWSAIVPGVLASLWSRGLALANLLSLVLITPLVVFYLLVDWHPMISRIESWLPRDRAATISRLFEEMDAAVAAFVRGQGVVCLILGVLYALALSWAGVHYGMLIGLATGFLSFVPFVGWALGFLTALATVLVQAWPDLQPLYLVVVIFLTGMALDAAFLSPRIVGSRVGLHPLALLLALTVFSYALGFVGLLLAVPLAAAFAVLVRYALEVYLGSNVYRGKAPVAPVKSDGPGAGAI